MNKKYILLLLPLLLLGCQKTNGDLSQQENNYILLESSKETYYSFDLTEFIRNNFGTSGVKRQKLLMSMTDEASATTFSQVVFTNDPLQERQCRLDVRFKTYNEQ